ncbi:MAG: DUF423 domain-containing protein [Xanthomarina sp.]
MKKWNFKVKSNVQEVIKKLDATLGSFNGFVFNREIGKNDSVAFKVRKRGLYAFYLMFTNKVIVNGKILKTDIENETTIEISFAQYFLWKLVIFTCLFSGLCFLIAIISQANSSDFMYLIGGLLVGVGIVLWITVQKKFKNDVQEYKTLISGILEA